MWVRHSVLEAGSVSRRVVMSHILPEEETYMIAVRSVERYVAAKNCREGKSGTVPTIDRRPHTHR